MGNRLLSHNGPHLKGPLLERLLGGELSRDEHSRVAAHLGEGPCEHCADGLEPVADVRLDAALDRLLARSLVERPVAHDPVRADVAFAAVMARTSHARPARRAPWERVLAVAAVVCLSATAGWWLAGRPPPDVPAPARIGVKGVEVLTARVHLDGLEVRRLRPDTAWETVLDGGAVSLGDVLAFRVSADGPTGYAVVVELAGRCEVVVPGGQTDPPSLAAGTHRLEVASETLALRLVEPAGLRTYHVIPVPRGADGRRAAIAMCREPGTLARREGGISQSVRVEAP